MARTAEVVTIKSLNEKLAEARLHFANGAQAKEVAKQVENIPDAYKMLMASVELHEQNGFKCLRSIQVKVINALSEASISQGVACDLILMASDYKLFESGSTGIEVVEEVEKKLPE